MPHLFRALTFMLVVIGSSVCAQPAAPSGELKGTAWVHSEQSLAATVAQADVCLPGAATGGRCSPARRAGHRLPRSGAASSTGAIRNASITASFRRIVRFL
jgi:hypothetical protein